MRMEGLPSSMVVHKRVATLDTRLAEMDGELVSNPFERNLGFYDFGRYTKVAEDADFAFEKLNDMWNEEIQAELNSDDEAEEGSTEASDSEMEETIETKRPRLERNRLKRKQNDRTETSAVSTTEKRAKIDDGKETSQDKFLKDLWHDINVSVDKLYIVRRQDKARGPADWHLIQVDLDKTNARQARKVGEYHIKYYVRQFTDAKKRLVRNCRFWPLIREIKPDGNFGDIIVLRPNKVETALIKAPYSRRWYQETVNLAEVEFVGPFNFCNVQGEANRIATDIWKALKERDEVRSGSVDIGDLNRITPLH
jgi:hypothetical protein